MNISTNLVIGNTFIKQDSEGRYCLNDLHKAAGNEKRHQPFNWLQLEQTQELISEIEQSCNFRSAIRTQNGGKDKGTYSVKELVYSYAMWISAKFHLHVIHAYDDLVKGQLVANQQPLKLEEAKITEADRIVLINLMYPKKQNMEDREPWNKFNAHFGVKKIMQLPASRMQEAEEWIKALPSPHFHLSQAAIEGDHIPRGQQELELSDGIDRITLEQVQQLEDALYPRCKNARDIEPYQKLYQGFSLRRLSDMPKWQFEKAMEFINNMPLASQQEFEMHWRRSVDKLFQRDAENVVGTLIEFVWRLEFLLGVGPYGEKGLELPGNRGKAKSKRHIDEFMEKPIWESHEVSRNAMRRALAWLTEQKSNGGKGTELSVK